MVSCGPQPEEAIRAPLDKVLPREEELKRNSDAARKTTLTGAAVAQRRPAALFAERWRLPPLLAEAQIALNRSEEAEAVLKPYRYRIRIPVIRLVAQIELLKQAADTCEIQQLQQQVAENPRMRLLATQIRRCSCTVSDVMKKRWKLLFSHLEKDLTAAEDRRANLPERSCRASAPRRAGVEIRRQLYALPY